MAATPAPSLVPFARAACHVVVGRVGYPVIEAEWYAYVATKSTIRVRDGRLLVRVSDHLDDAPDDVLRGLMVTLVARLHRRSVPAAAAADVAAYRDYLHAEHVRDRRVSSHRQRGRKVMSPEGRHRSLTESYLRVCLQMDVPAHEPPRLGWGPTASRRRFGHHDPAHGAIVISRVLDDAKVPEWVLDFVVYHEVLHIIHPPEPGMGRTGRRRVHTPAFRAAEQRFPQYDEAEAWLRALAAGQSRISATLSKPRLSRPASTSRHTRDGKPGPRYTKPV